MIKVVFITNILCRHQVGVWDPLSKMEDIDFIYLCTRNPNEKISLRYKCDSPRNYTINSQQLNDLELNKILSNADIIFYGSIEDNRIWSLLFKNIDKTYIITEHYSKEDFSELYKFRGIRRKLIFNLNIKKTLNAINKEYIFCASSHTGEDFKKAGAKRQSTLKFGYFPYYNYAINEDIKNKDKYSIFFVGRNIPWKKPEISLRFLHYINKFDSNYWLEIIGEGFANYDRLSDHNVIVTEPMDNKQLLEAIKKKSIFVFPSNRGEGWGNVLGEAMAAGCICFANVDAGSTKYLIKNGINGFTFKNILQLKKRIRKYLSLNEEEINTIRRCAINTMQTSWNGETAAKRLYAFIVSKIRSYIFTPYKDGPLSLDK